MLAGTQVECQQADMHDDRPPGFSANPKELHVTAAGSSVLGDLDASIIVPTFREAENLGHLLPRVSAAMKSTGRTWEILIVDDNSQDGTLDVAAKLVAAGHPLRLITRVGERGLSSAVVRGFQEARGRRLVCMDADLSHPPEALPALLATLDEPGVEFVIGSRYVPGAGTDEAWGVFRWLNSKIATLLARPFTSARDPMAGFFALPRTVFERAAALNPIGYKIGLELIVKARCRTIREIPIHFADRKYGQSKLSLSEQIRYVQHLKRLADFKFGVFSRFAQFCAVGASGMAVDLAAYAVLLGISLPTWLARAIAIWVAMTWNFALNRHFTFSDGRALSALRQYPRFVLSCSVGALVSWSLAMGLGRTSLLAPHVYIAAVLGIVAGTLVNFVASLYWIFRREYVTALPPTNADGPEA